MEKEDVDEKDEEAGEEESVQSQSQCSSMTSILSYNNCNSSF